MPVRHYRAHLRLRVEMMATVRSGRGVEAEARVVDLSLGGASVELDVPLRLGEGVELILSGMPSLYLQGRVAWVTWGEGGAVRAGVRFQQEALEAVQTLLGLMGIHAQVS